MFKKNNPETDKIMSSLMEAIKREIGGEPVEEEFIEDWLEDIYDNVRCIVRYLKKERMRGRNLDEIEQKIQEILPESNFDEDNEGQIVIYTGLKRKEGQSDKVVPMIVES